MSSRSRTALRSTSVGNVSFGSVVIVIAVEVCKCVGRLVGNDRTALKSYVEARFAVNREGVSNGLRISSMIYCEQLDI